MGAAGLIGRDAAIEALDDAVAATRSGRGRLLLISGDPGIGKTALAAELLHRAARPGTVTVWAACSPGVGAPAYWPWVQVLRAVARQVPDEPLPGPLARLAGDQLHGFEPPDQGGHDRARFLLFDTLAGYLTDIGHRVPLVLIVDDLHWADEPALLALRFVAERLPSAPVLLVGTYRDVEAGPRLRDIARGAQLLGLAGLDEAGVGELMARLQRTAARDAVSDDVARAVWLRTGGNPFFARELTRLLPADPHGAPGIPEGVRDILARRLERLSPECRTLLEYAALLGSPFEADVLAQLHGRPHGRTVDLLEQASAHRIVLRLPGPGGQHRFVHDLFRETVAQSLGTADREARHLALARVLIDRSARGRPIPAARIAEQLCAAGLPAAPDAVRFAVRAAAEATSQLAYEDACDHLERARAAAESSEDVQSEDHLEVLIRLGDASHAAGRAEASREALLAGSVLARHLGEPVGTARCALGLHRLGVRAGFHDPATVALLDEAAAALPESALSWRALVLAATVRHRHHHRLQQDALGTELAGRALALARAHGDAGVLATCLLAAHDAAWSPASAAARLPIVEEMIDAADQAGDAELRLQAAQLRATILLELGDPEGSAALAAYCRQAEQLGYPRARWNAVTRRATLATITGSVQEATELLREGLALGQQVGEPDAGGVAATQALTVYWLAHLTGEPGPLIPIEERALRAGGDAFGRRDDPLLRALGLLAAGDRAAAARALEGYAVGDLPVSHDAEFVVLAAWAFTQVGSQEGCRHLYECLAPLAGTGSVVGGAAAFQGPVDLSLGQLADALGELDAAATHYQAAARFARRLGAPLWERAAEAQLGTINVFVRSGDLWRLRYAGREVVVTDSKGLHDLAALLASPGTEIAVSRLLGLPAHPVGADQVLDARARAEYRRRLTELQAEQQAAEELPDLGRAERARAEYEFIVAELAAATGLGGRSRLLADETERARKTVTARIRYAVHRIAGAHPELAEHLTASVRTGILCSYQPSHPVAWRT